MAVDKGACQPGLDGGSNGQDRREGRAESPKTPGDCEAPTLPAVLLCFCAALPALPALPAVRLCICAAPCVGLGRATRLRPCEVAWDVIGRNSGRTA